MLMICFQGTISNNRSAEWYEDEEGDENFESIRSAQRAMVENAGLSMDLLNSWNLNPLELDKAARRYMFLLRPPPGDHTPSVICRVLGRRQTSARGQDLPRLNQAGVGRAQSLSWRWQSLDISVHRRGITLLRCSSLGLTTMGSLSYPLTWTTSWRPQRPRTKIFNLQKVK